MAGSLPFRSAADRSAARSTTAGTPVDLENDPRRCEREFDIRNVRLPRRDVSNVFDGYRLPVDVAENGLEENADTDGELVEFTETLLFEDCEVGHLVGCAVELEFADCVEWRRFVHTLSYGDVALELSPWTG